MKTNCFIKVVPILLSSALVIFFISCNPYANTITEKVSSTVNADIDSAAIADNSRSISPQDRTLLLVHGWKDSSLIFNGLLADEFDYSPQNNINDFKDYYGTADKNIIKIDYYGENTLITEFKEVTVSTSITEIASKLATCLLRLKRENKIYDHLDIAAHSMGGLIVRYMVKHYYIQLKDAGITIDHIATIATPNHGTTLALLAMLIGITANDVQALEMVTNSAFLTSVNNEIETPYNINYSGNYNTIKWCTFRGRVLSWYDWACLTDGVVNTDSVPLNGATNYGVYEHARHDVLPGRHDVLKDLYGNFFVPAPAPEPNICYTYTCSYTSGDTADPDVTSCKFLPAGKSWTIQTPAGFTVTVIGRGSFRYVFAGWNLDYGNVSINVSNNGTTVFTMHSAGPASVTAQYASVPTPTPAPVYDFCYTINRSFTSGSSDSPYYTACKQMTVGQTISIPTPTGFTVSVPGRGSFPYTFDKWNMESGNVKIVLTGTGSTRITLLSPGNASIRATYK